jgi:hypothetical protein
MEGFEQPRLPFVTSDRTLCLKLHRWGTLSLYLTLAWVLLTTSALSLHLTQNAVYTQYSTPKLNIATNLLGDQSVGWLRGR